MRLSSLLFPSPLSHHVRHVLGMSARAQMIRIATRRVIAGVHHGQAFWDRTLKGRVSDPVRPHPLAPNLGITIPVLGVYETPVLKARATLNQKRLNACLVNLHRIINRRGVALGIMPSDVSLRLTLDRALEIVGALGDWCRLSASALTKHSLFYRAGRVKVNERKVAKTFYRKIL